MLRIAQLLTVLLIAVFTFAVSPQAAPPAVPGLSISGSGIVNAIDDFGAEFANAGQFSISAGLRADGSARGSLNFVGRGEFAAAWGACPYDPRCEDYPNTATKTFHLSGQVQSLVAIGSDVVASGTLTEIDHGKGDGVIFEEYDVPFSVTATEGSDSVVLQFCLLPPFTLEMASGNLSVSASTPKAKLFERPGLPVARALTCPGPQPASR
jgi:hypothetical protein